MLINIDSNKYKDMTLASLHMGLIADRFKKRQSIKDLTIKEIIESVGNNGQAFCRALLDGGTDEENFVGQTLLVLEFDGDLKYVSLKEENVKNIACPMLLHIKHLEAVQTKRDLELFF
ncbi:MAG: hypothetical protein ACLTS6_03035 [Anaerobutyricum sp.]